jgi:uncharacterized membrane protein
MESITNPDRQDVSKTGQAGNGSMTDKEKWASIVGGGALVLSGLQQRSLRGVLMAIAGGGMVYHGATSDKSITQAVGDAVGVTKNIKVEKTVTINKSAEELYRYWRNFENLYEAPQVGNRQQ